MATLKDWLTWWFVVIPVCMGLAYGLDLLLGWQWSWRDAALGVALGFVLRVWLLHRLAGQPRTRPGHRRPGGRPAGRR